MFSVGTTMVEVHRSVPPTSSDWRNLVSALKHRDPTIRPTARQVHRTAKEIAEKRAESLYGAGRKIQPMGGGVINAELAKVGAPVMLREVNTDGHLQPVADLSRLTTYIFNQLKIVVDMFHKTSNGKRVRRIDYIWNVERYEDFDNSRKQFRKLGKPWYETLLFHGTNPAVVDLYSPHLLKCQFT
jgi:hypothetical protein